MPPRIAAFKLILEPLDEEAESAVGFREAASDVGLRHRLGGDPTFIQGGYFPTCSSCAERMTFFAQLDSVGDDLCLADCGILYVFVCFDCFTSESFIQSG
jgi:hypothetical protein